MKCLSTMTEEALLLAAMTKNETWISAFSFNSFIILIP